MPLLNIRNLTVRFATSTGTFTAVDGIALNVDRGEVLPLSANPVRGNPSRCWG